MTVARRVRRRAFLIDSSLLAAGAAISDMLPRRAGSAPATNLTELSAVGAVDAVRNGDVKAEDYARALLDRAQQLESLNAFRVLNRDMVLGARFRCRTRLITRVADPGEGQRQHQSFADIQRHTRLAGLRAEGQLLTSCSCQAKSVSPQQPDGAPARSIVSLVPQAEKLWLRPRSLRWLKQAAWFSVVGVSLFL